jgi:hypothetical protein
VGRGSALGAADRGWEVAWAAVDGEHKLRRRSGDARWSGKKMAVEMGVRECERKDTGRGHSE